MEITTCEQKVLADLEQAEHDLAQLEDENLRLRARVEDLEKLVVDLGEQAHRQAVERDHHADCVKDMLATAAFYGFKQPGRIEYNPETGTMRPAGGEPAAEDEGLA